jgi:hypothetical protein
MQQGRHIAHNYKFESGWEVGVSVVYCKRKWKILWNVRVFRGINKALKQQPRPIRLKAFDKKGPHAGKFCVKYKDSVIQTGGRTLFGVRVMEKTSTGFCWGSRAVIPLRVTMTVSAGGPIFCFVVLLKSL